MLLDDDEIHKYPSPTNCLRRVTTHVFGGSSEGRKLGYSEQDYDTNVPYV